MISDNPSCNQSVMILFYVNLLTNGEMFKQTILLTSTQVKYSLAKLLFCFCDRASKHEPFSPCLPPGVSGGPQAPCLGYSRNACH